ncbi:MAG: xylulokinase [Deltaproteobacteria bacterium]|nr:xylulokinase [Deltaproteobacteria bacterium]
MSMFLGIDVGTSGVKALLIDETGRTIGEATAPLELQTPQPGWAEQHPDAHWKASIKAVREALAKAKKTAKVMAIGLSGQMHSSVFLDRENRVIRPALLWCDGRTTAECEWITKTVGAAGLRKHTSNPALEGFTLPKVLWLRKHEPAAFARLAKVVLPKDYIRLCLTGTLATDPSDASATLMYDTAKQRWSSTILKATKLSLHLVPDVVSSSEVSGRLSIAAAATLGLPAGIPVAGGGADNACGAIGVGVVTPGEAVVSWGTSGTVLAPTAKPVVDPGLRAHTFCHAVPDTWYVMGVMLTAGGAFGWYRDIVANNPKAGADLNTLLNDEAASIPIGSLGLTFLPYLQGERTPHRDATARGAFIGLSLAHKRAHLSRAVLEGITFGLRDSVEILRAMKLPLDRMLLTGGGARSAFVRQLQADVFGLPVVQVNREQGPAFGAALLAAVSVGAFASVPAACKATLSRLAPTRFDKKAHKAYAQPYARFQKLYPALAGKF